MFEDSAGRDAHGAGHLSKLHWTERARRMVDYQVEALDFIRRASERHPVSNEHIYLLLRLWVEADALDGLILPLLNELNTELMSGQAELDTTRGVTIESSPFVGLTDAGDEEVVYQCAWWLRCPSGRSVCVILAASAGGVFYSCVRGGASAHEQRIGYPVTESALQDALVSSYVAEATLII